MASMEEDNKPHSAVSGVNQAGKNLLSKYKKLEDVLTDKSISFDQKIPALVTVWLRLQELIHNSQSKSIDRIIEWAQRHTLNLVLNGDWASQSEELKRKLYTVVEQFDCVLATCEQLTSRRCKKLIEVIKDPWGDSTLCKILNNPNTCTKEEELQYFSSEHGYLVAMRLKKLCDSHCEDLALHFANACLRCLRLPESQNFLVVTTEDQKRYIFDIYIALLHKYKRTHDIINELKNLSLDEGLQLVQRFTKKRIELSRVWKHCCRIAELAAQFFVTAAMTKPIDEIGTILNELLSAWAALNDKLDGLDALPNVMRRIIQTADSAAHIYICCQVLNEKFGDKIKSFTIELYIRALTTDMNEMEKQKSRSEDDKVQETSKRLSQGFLSLADLLQDHLGVSRECVLTSFSLNPTRTCLERIEKLATECMLFDKEILSNSESGIPVIDTGQPHLPPPWTEKNAVIEKNESTKERTLDALILIKGDAVTGCKNYDVLSAPSQVLDAEALGISSQLCDDLAVVLSSPRYQLLSWVLDWTELKIACEKYLSNVEGTRNPVKELKYLNIDYNQFKNWPTDREQQYGGIEKGYEQWADEDNSNTDSVSDYHNLLYSQGNESDCSSATLRGRRRRKTVRRIYSSESEYDFVENKCSQSSDIDTASQDADSLGSDGLQHVSNNKKAKTNSTSNLPHLAIIVNTHNNNPTSAVPNFDVNDSSMMSIFGCLDDPAKQLSLPKTPSCIPNSTPILLPEKKLSRDPQVLRSLRMFRTNKRNKDNVRPLTLVNDINKDNLDDSEEVMAKLRTLPHMNPRVLLDRQDINTFTSNKKPLIKDPYSLLNDPAKYNEYIAKQHMNPCVLLNRCEDIQNLYNKNKHSVRKKLVSCDSSVDRKRRKLDALIDVPGLKTLDLIRPVVMPQTVQVVQLSSNQMNQQSQQMRNIKPQTSNSSISNTGSPIASITSTPVTAHIQRIGQPRQQDLKISRASNEADGGSATASGDLEMPANSDAGNGNIGINSNSGTTAVTSDDSSVKIVPPSSQPQSQSQSQSTPTLVNILSQQTIRPAQIASPVCRSPTLINILSQQIIRPPLSQTVPIVCVTSASGLSNSLLSNVTSITSVTTTMTQAQNSLKLVSTNSSQHQILQQLFNAQGKNSQVLKNVNVVTTGLANPPTSVDTSRLVQFLCKTDGKMIQLTPYSTNSNIKLHTIDSSKLVKTAVSNSNNVAGTKLVTTQSTALTDSSPLVSIRSGYEENYAKFIQTAAKSPNKMQSNETSNDSSSTEQASSLPKFQQAFGKPVYQTTSSSVVDQNTITLHSALVTSAQTSVTTVNTNSISSVNLPSSGSPVKNANNVTTIPVQISANKTAAAISPLGLQATIQGGVIYTRHVPVSLNVNAGHSINLISNVPTQAAVNRNQIFRITSASGDQMNFGKDTVIRSNMSALLAAALQSGVPGRASVVSSTTAAVTTTVPTTTTTTSSSAITSEMNTSFSSRSQSDASEGVEADGCEVDSSSSDSCNTNTTTSTTSTTTLVTPMRIALPMMQRTTDSNGIQSTRIVRPVLQIPTNIIRGGRQQVVLASTQPIPNITRTSQAHSVAFGDNLLTTHNMQPVVSSTTLEQLREFDLVLEQVKERSTTVQPGTPGQSTPVRTPEKSDLSEVIQGVNVSYMNQNQKVSPCASVVVVTSYCNIQPAASPALSVTSQSSSSPSVTPAPSSSGKTIPKTASKSSKSKTVKTTTTHASKTSPVPKPQQKPQEDEQTTQRIFDILAEYAEQLRNSPDLNNKPAPRRRSNPPTNPSQNSKRKKSTGSKKTATSHCNSMNYDLSPGADDPRTIGSEDSSCGVVQISVQDSPSQSTPSTDDHQTSTSGATDFSSIRTQVEKPENTGAETIENQLPSSGRQFIFTDSNTNQSRNVIIADSAVNEALGKISNAAAVIVPANYIAVVSGNSKILATVPARSGSNMLLFQGFVNQARKPVVATQQNIKSIKYSTIQPLHGISSQTLTGVSAQPPVVLPTNITETLTSKSVSNIDNSTSNNDCLPATGGELLLNVVTTNIAQTASDKLHLVPKIEDNCNSNHIETISSQHTNSSVENSDIEIKSEKCETDDIVAENTFTLNFAGKTPSNISVIEKTVRIVHNNTPQSNNIPDSLQPHDSHITSKNVVTVASAGTAPNISFSEMDCADSVDDYTKDYVGDKKIKTNTNGPMLGQTESTIVRDDTIIVQPSKDDVHEKVSRELMDAPTSYTKLKKTQGSFQRNEKELQVQQRKQAALERELHLQKSLSEECEDLGVDEPSTSDLFPEADLLFDSNNSPSFDQLSHDVDKRYAGTNYQMETSCSSTEEDYNKKSALKKSHHVNAGVKATPASAVMPKPVLEKREINVIQNTSASEFIQDQTSKATEPTIMLFSEEDNSDSTLRADLLFSNLNYPNTEVEFEYDEKPKVRSSATNCSKDSITLQSSTNNYTVTSYDDHGLLTTCTSIMEVCSPLHYDIHADSPPPVHKYKYKYCNRKKLTSIENKSAPKIPEKMDNSWHRGTNVIEVTSSDESSGSASPDRAKSSASPSPSPTGSDRKRASPSWNEHENDTDEDNDDDGDDDDDADNSNQNYKRIYNSNKILKLSVGGKIVEPLTLGYRDDGKTSAKLKECNALITSNPASPLSPMPSDGELGSFSTGRGARRSTQRLKKNCPCCTSPEKPKKGTNTTTNIKKLVKGQLSKKR